MARLPPCLAPDGLGYGDVDGDGYVTDADANLVSDYTVGNATLTSEQLIRADVNGDGNVTITDSMLIGRYAAGLIGTFSVCPAYNIVFIFPARATITVI